MPDLPWKDRWKRATALQTMGEDDDELVHELPYQEQSDE
jgi:hypothetical protein